MSFLSSLASLVEFLNEEKSLLLKLVEQLKQKKTIEQAYFIYAAIYSFSSKMNLSQSFGIVIHCDGRVLDPVCQLQHFGSRHLIPTPFAVCDLVKGGLMCFIWYSNIIQARIAL